MGQNIVGVVAGILMTIGCFYGREPFDRWWIISVASGIVFILWGLQYALLGACWLNQTFCVPTP